MSCRSETKGKCWGYSICLLLFSDLILRYIMCVTFNQLWLQLQFILWLTLTSKIQYVFWKTWLMSSHHLEGKPSNRHIIWSGKSLRSHSMKKYLWPLNHTNDLRLNKQQHSVALCQKIRLKLSANLQLNLWTVSHDRYLCLHVVQLPHFHLRCY